MEEKIEEVQSPKKEEEKLPMRLDEANKTVDRRGKKKKLRVSFVFRYASACGAAGSWSNLMSCQRRQLI